MGVTTKHNLPYPELTDQANVPQDMKNLCEKIEETFDGYETGKISYLITTEEAIEQNVDYQIPQYNDLVIYYEGTKLIKDIHYIEVDSTHIQFKDWDVPANRNIEFLYN